MLPKTCLWIHLEHFVFSKLRLDWGPAEVCHLWNAHKLSIAHRYSSEYKNGEDHGSSDLLKALAVEVSGLHSEFECRLKESNLHIVVELELFGVIHTENTIKKKGKQNPFL